MRQRLPRSGPHLLFVYGTLRSDDKFTNGAKMQGAGCRLLSRDAIIHGQLVALWGGAYPGLLDGDGTVYGEVWVAPNSASLAKLDEYEGPEYRRVRRSVLTTNGNGWDFLWCWTYRLVLPVPDANAVPIASGDWQTVRATQHTAPDPDHPEVPLSLEIGFE